VVYTKTYRAHGIAYINNNTVIIIIILIIIQGTVFGVSVELSKNGLNTVFKLINNS